MKNSEILHKINKQILELESLKFDQFNEFKSWHHVTKGVLEYLFGQKSPEVRIFSSSYSIPTEQSEFDSFKSGYKKRLVTIKELVSVSDNLDNKTLTEKITSPRLNHMISLAEFVAKQEKDNEKKQETSELVAKRKRVNEKKQKTIDLVDGIALKINQNDTLLLAHVIDMRDKFFKKTFWFSVIICILSISIVPLNNILNFGLSDTVLIALLSQIPIQFIGILVIIARNLFPGKKKKDNIGDEYGKETL
jgi:hypothetical protein